MAEIVPSNLTDGTSINIPVASREGIIPVGTHPQAQALNNAVCKVVAEMGALPKRHTIKLRGGQYQVHTWEDVNNHLRPIMNRHGLWYYQSEEASWQEGNKWFARVRITVVHSNGGQVELVSTGVADLNGTNPCGAAVTFAVRPALCHFFGVITELDHQDGANNPEEHDNPQPAAPAASEMSDAQQTVWDRLGESKNWPTDLREELRNRAKDLLGGGISRSYVTAATDKQLELLSNLLSELERRHVFSEWPSEHHRKLAERLAEENKWSDKQQTTIRVLAEMVGFGAKPNNLLSAADLKNNTEPNIQRLASYLDLVDNPDVSELVDNLAENLSVHDISPAEMQDELADLLKRVENVE